MRHVYNAVRKRLGKSPQVLQVYNAMMKRLDEKHKVLVEKRRLEEQHRRDEERMAKMAGDHFHTAVGGRSSVITGGGSAYPSSCQDLGVGGLLCAKIWLLFGRTDLPPVWKDEIVLPFIFCNTRLVPTHR